ncbi:hypothetical protein D3C72_1794860 [compost metagenome]
MGFIESQPLTIQVSTKKPPMSPAMWCQAIQPVYGVTAPLRKRRRSRMRRMPMTMPVTAETMQAADSHTTTSCHSGGSARSGVK